MLDPFERSLSTTTRWRSSDRLTFRDPPRSHTYTVKLPIEGVTISYRVLDAAHAALKSGTGQTDMFGSITIDDVGEAAVGIEATYEGTTAVVPVPATSPAQPPARSPH